ncbi:hypothetical protein GCM10022251_19130 [Phytohabitans flavus]|uniref:Uncharacterized protein n=1 Tax=Phytohabitans flavus TaxID=1076124 RepID=A0A6F8XZ52_9ACTN|nr:hypothetical protein [Phytohabitans flavus]BCB79087.1 hypothetical protein Pflav_054970 [Phytohabitans flavus]
MKGTMRYKTPLGRLGLACAAASMVALAAAAPARAEEPVEYGWAQPSMEYVVNVAMDATTPKPIKITVENSVPTAAVDVTVKIDTSTVSAAFKLDLPGADQGCTVAGKVATCTLAELPGESKKVYTIDALPGDLEVLEYQGLIQVTTSAANMPEDQQAEGYVQLMSPGIDLVMDQIDDMTLEPGRAAKLPIQAANVGTVAAAGVEVILSVGLEIEFPDQYENCTYNPDFLELNCWVLGDVAPGDVFAIADETPLRIAVKDKAAGPDKQWVSARVAPLGEEQIEELAAKAASKRSAGQQLRLAEVGPIPDLNDYDNFTQFNVNIPKNSADSVAIGGTVPGAVGDEVDLKVGLRNDGPNNMLKPGEEWAASALVTLPAGVKALTVSDRCTPIVDGEAQWEDEGKPIGLVYVCWPSDSLNAGEEFLFPFKVEIVDTASAAGSIVVDGGVQDPDTSNNTAEITMGAGSGGGGGGLPVTGARAGLVAGVGALLVAAGVVAVVLLRRRRIVTVVE